MIIQVNDLSAGYKDNMVIKNVTAGFESGKIYSVIGPNGCGKTTLLRTISRNLKPFSGQVLLNGENIFKMNTKHAARQIAVLSQVHNTMSDVTVKTLVQYGRYAHKEWWRGNTEEDSRIVDWAIETTGMTDFINRRISDLSGGERQRAWIAMSVAQKPKVLLLDEPTTYLDISHQLEIMELIKRLNREENITIIMVLHDINHAARYSDELIVIDDNRIYSRGSPWEILNAAC